MWIFKKIKKSLNHYNNIIITLSLLLFLDFNSTCSMLYRQRNGSEVCVFMQQTITLSQGRDCTAGGARLGFFPFKILSYGPCFEGTGIVVEKEDVLGDGDWTLAADLLDDFGQNDVCTI